jgi:predicted secreted protein
VRSEGAACGAGPWSSTAVTVTVNQPAISPTGISATPQSFCGSGTVALKVVGGSLGTGGAAWKWYRNATCSGTSFASGAEVTDTITATTTYGVRAEGGSCNLSTNPVTLTVPLNVAAGVPTGTAIPESVCPGDMVTLSASGNPGTGGSWVWYKSDKKTPVSATTFAAQGSETYYVRSENGACGDGPFSTSVGVTIKIPSTNPTGININKTLPVCKYASVTLTVLGGSLGTNAKWVWYTNSSYVGTPVASSTLTSLTVTPENTTTYYVRAEGDCNNTTASISQKIDVYTGLSVLVSQTESQGACGYATFNYKAVATGSTGYTYEWQRTVEDGTFVSFDVYLSRLGPTGINSETLVINDQQFNGSIFQIRCVVNDICGKTVITDPIYYSSGAYIECP